MDVTLAESRTTRPSTSPRASWLFPLLLVVLGVSVYANAVSTPFVFDDKDYILDNPTVPHLFAPTRHLPPYPQTGYMDDNTRPVVFLTLAVDYTLGGYSPAIFHLTNILIHLLAALTLYGILRRVFSLPQLSARFAEPAASLAFTIAAVWVVHPLNTMAVTYIWQRCESLMGLFYLLTVYCFLRGATATSKGHGWFIVAITCCLLGMGSKEVMVSAPIFILLFDRALLAGSFRAALAQRWRVHAGLFACLALLAWLTTNAEKFHSNPGVGIKTFAGTMQYLATMPSVYCFYLLRTVWPTPLCLDHQWRLATGVADILPYLIPVVVVLGATAWAFVKRPAWSLPGLGFLLILAPTSSIMPMPDPVCEYRNYLPLTLLLSAGICGIYLLLNAVLPATGLAGLSRNMRRLLWSVIGGVILLLSYLTIERNFVYRGDISLWRDVVRQYPDNSRGRYNLANALNKKGRFEEAQVEYKRGRQLAPLAVRNLVNMGTNLLALGRVAEACEVLRRAITLKPDNGLAELNLGLALRRVGDGTTALPHLERAAKLLPNDPRTHKSLGVYWFSHQDYARAQACFTQGLQLAPRRADLHNNLASVFGAQGKMMRAIKHFKIAVRLKPDYFSARLNLGIAYEITGQPSKAAACYRQALALRPADVETKKRLTRLLGQ